MIIDLILDRKDGDEYNARKFYRRVTEYGKIGFEISFAMDCEEEPEVKAALCNYIDYGNYNPAIKDYINSVQWLDETI